MTIRRDDSYDTVVLGSGIAGLSAALASAKHGLRTLLLESSARVGGVTSHSWGLIWVGSNHLARKQGITDTRVSVVEYMKFLSGGQAFQESMETFVDESPKALEFYETCGIPFRLVNGVTDHYYGMTSSTSEFGRSIETELVSGAVLGDWQDKVEKPLNMPSWVTAEEMVKWGGVLNSSKWDPAICKARVATDTRGMGVGLVTHFLSAALKAGVEIRLNQWVDELITSDGRVSGVKLADGRSIGCRAGVVIATGGYESNPQMVSDFEGLPGWLSYSPPSLKGRGLVLGTSVGGAVHVIQNNHQLMLAFRVPASETKDAENWMAAIIELACPHTMVVNRDGKRFADESYFQRMSSKIREFDVGRHEHTNLPCFLIFDQNFADKFSFAGRPIGTPIPDWVERAPTLAGLAEKLKIDPRGLAATGERFSADVRSGRDMEFHRGELKWTLTDENQGRPATTPRSLGVIDRAPFYGIELGPTGSSAAGLLINKHAQVLTYDRRPVSGLYAVGNSAARTEFGAGYQAGLTLASGMTFGLLAAMHMTASDRGNSRPH